MDGSQLLNFLEKALLVAGPLAGIWLSHFFENKREAKRNAIEQDRLAQENMRWVASGHLTDITAGFKKLGKQMFELGQAVYDLRPANRVGLQFGVQENQWAGGLEKARKNYEQADGRYLEALNEVSVFMSKEEDLAFRDLLTITRIWVGSLGLRGDPEFIKHEREVFKKFNETLETLRHELRRLLAPKNILSRLSKDE